MYNLVRPLARTPRFLSLHAATTASSSLRAYSSGSPSKGQTPEHFTKTGEKPEPGQFSSRSYEYSQSGGDDMVAGQGGAAFEQAQDTDPQSQKERAGRGNAVNPLEFSPATRELSRAVPADDVTKSAEREAGAKTGQGVSRKAKTVKKDGIDFQPGYAKKTPIPNTAGRGL